MRDTFYNDYKKGTSIEPYVVQYLNEKRKDKYILSKEQKSEYDFYNSRTLGELKSRNNKYKSYGTTFFGYNKLKYFLSQDKFKRFKIYFLFTDGLYYWKYKEGEYSIRPYHNNSRQKIEEYVYVPIKHLKCLSSKITTNNIKQMVKLIE